MLCIQTRLVMLSFWAMSVCVSYKKEITTSVDQKLVKCQPGNKDTRTKCKDFKILKNHDLVIPVSFEYLRGKNDSSYNQKIDLLKNNSKKNSEKKPVQKVNAYLIATTTILVLVVVALIVVIVCLGEGGKQQLKVSVSIPAILHGMSDVYEEDTELTQMMDNNEKQA